MGLITRGNTMIGDINGDNRNILALWLIQVFTESNLAWDRGQTEP